MYKFNKSIQHKISPPLLKLAAVLLCSCSLYSPLAHANGLAIDKMSNVLKSNENVLLKKIINDSSEMIFVKIDVFELKHDGDKVQQIPVTRLTGNQLNRDMVVVTPQRLMIPAKSFQNIRVIVPPEMSRDRERIYSLQVTPVVPSKRDGFEISEQALSDYKARQIKVGVQFLIGYAPKVFVMPVQPRFNSMINSNANGVTIVNGGNAPIILANIKTCKKADKYACKRGGESAIRAGKRVDLTKGADEQVHFTLVEDQQQKALTY